MVYIFLDTNILLHCKPLEEISWASYTERDFKLVLAPIVIDELDKHKQNPKIKIARRAKQFIAKLENRLEADSQEIVLLTQRPRPESFERYQFDPRQQDDSLLLTIIEFSEARPNDSVVLATNDLGPRIKAKTISIQTLKLPDTELLPVELDESERQIQNLTKEIQSLKHLIPKVDLYFTTKTQLEKIPLPLSIEDFEEFKNAKMVAIKKANHHMRREEEDPFKNPLLLMMVTNRRMLGITNEHVDKFNRSLDAFFIAYKEYLKKLYAYEENKRCTLSLDLSIHNDGNTPAHDVDITLLFQEHIRVLKEADYPKAPAEPKVPEQPKGIMATFSHSNETIARYIGNQQAPVDPEEPVIHEEETTTVRFHFAQVKHEQRRLLQPLVLQFESLTKMNNFSIPYVLNISNVPKAIKGTLNVVITK